MSAVIWLTVWFGVYSLLFLGFLILSAAMGWLGFGWVLFGAFILVFVATLVTWAISRVRQTQPR